MIQPFFVFSDWGILILRVVLGIILIAHGWPKIKNVPAVASWMGPLGFKPPMFWAWLVSLVEFGGGALLVLGLFTQGISLIVAVQFIVIILKVKGKKGLVDGYEFDLLILAATIALLTLGGGALSLEKFFHIILY